MAAGAGAASGGSLESTLDRKFRSVTNTMDSIQGLSTWCIDNKKYHSLIVRHWLKCLRKSDPSHRLNLLYLANDVIQNCKRKNAIVYRTAFADVLSDAFLLVNHESDSKVIKSVERILSIWEERDVYSGALIAELRSILVKEDSPPVEQKTPVESKADLRSKVVAEFVPQALMEQLSKYKKSLEEVDLKEKQLAAMRVDILSSDALKKLKDKAGGKKFSRDFEEGSAQLHEFVKFFEKQSKVGSPLLEALGNADIFYEMQYKEVKIVANAYQTFANRVSHLKRKLDALKAALPDLDESPIPSPSADAPSPTGSESPFHGLELAHPDPDLDGSAMDDEAEPPAPSPLSSPGGSPKHTQSLGEKDNREVEDMDLSDEEMDSGGIIVEDQIKPVSLPEVSTPISTKSEASVATEPPVLPAPAPVTAPTAALESVDVGKIGSILNNFSSVMKNTAPGVASPHTTAPVVPPVMPTPAASVATQDPSLLVNILSKVDVSPADLLSALSKVQGKSSLEGITSLLSSSAATVVPDASSTGKVTPSPSSTSVSAAPSQSSSLSFVAPVPSSSSSIVQQSSSAQASPQTSNKASALVQALHRDMDLTTESEQSVSSTSLESKIHSFLQGNPAFSTFDLGFSANPAVGGDHFSPVAGTDTQDGTPVRDEGGGTPTQDEIMDKPAVVPFASTMNPVSAGEAVKMAPMSFDKNILQNSNTTQLQVHVQPGATQNGQAYRPGPHGPQDVAAPAHYQQISAHTGAPLLTERAAGGASNAQTHGGFPGSNERSWYGEAYQGNTVQPSGYNVTGGGREDTTLGLYSYPAGQTQEPKEFASQQQGGAAAPPFFGSMLPPVPKLPPPPPFDAPPPSANSTMIPPEQQPGPSADGGGVMGSRRDSLISGMVVHDHQHKSLLPADDPLYDTDAHHPRRPEFLPPHPDGKRYREDVERFREEPGESHFFNEDPFYRQNDAYFRPGSPPHAYPRVRGRMTPPLSPSSDLYYAHDYQQQSPPPLQYTPRRPPPHEIRHPGMRPPHRPPHPAHHQHPRGPPRPPFPRFLGPDPRLRGKRPVLRGGGPMFPPKRPFLPPRY